MANSINPDSPSTGGVRFRDIPSIVSGQSGDTHVTLHLARHEFLRWFARIHAGEALHIQVPGVCVELAVFDTPEAAEDAVAARRKAA